MKELVLVADPVQGSNLQSVAFDIVWKNDNFVFESFEKLAGFDVVECALQDGEQGLLLPRALLAALQRFGATRNVQDVSSATHTLMNSEAERLESELSMIRYIAWAIPSIGFIGTVRGIGAALGLAQLERIEELVAKKRQIYEWYRACLEGVEGIRLSAEEDWARSIHWMTSIVLEESLSADREDFRAKLRERKVDTRPVFPPMSGFPMF